MEPLKIHLDALEMSGKMIDKHIVADSNFPSLINLMRYNTQGGTTVSGLDVYDYPNLNCTSLSLTNINQMRMHSKIPLPSEVMEHFGHMQCHCMMGIFTNISKAWLTIDSDIYIWSYENESDVAYFDGLNETIISVGLVKPKAGIFQSYVKYLLILTTTIEITVLGVTIEGNDEAHGEIQLVPEPIFSVATDGIAITTIANTSSGRIFLGGRNGSLFEIYYQAESSWFGKRCKKINHSEGPLSFLVPTFISMALTDEEAIDQISVDDSRNILYTLGNKGTITVWDIDNGGAVKITSMSQASLVANSVHVVKTLDSNNFRPLVSISAISESESVHLHLVAVAATGTRFYFSCTPLNCPSARPQYLHLIHIRLPPGYTANAAVTRPRKVQMAHYRKGTLVLICGGDSQSAWCLSNDAYPFTNYLAETQSILPLDSPVWAMTEIPGESVIQIEKPSGSQGDPPLLVRQHMEPPRKFIFLTAQGATILIQVRPVDILRQLLLEQRGPDTELVRAYFQSQSPEQACATCLILATLENSQNAQLSEWATRAFFLYGSMKIATVHPADNTSAFQNILSADVCTSTPRNLPPLTQGFNTPQVSSGNIDLTLQQFSGKHGGLYLYIGRVIRPIWSLRCIKQEVINDKTQISSTVNSTQIGWILGHLQALRSFLNKNTHISKPNLSTRSITDGFDASLANHHQEPIVEERNSLDALKTFIVHACEILGLWKILCENQLNNIVSCLSKDQINQFSTATFRDLILIGHEISSLLIVHLIDSYLGDNASVDAVSGKLREICPNLYRSEDAVCSKANEIILRAKNCTNADEKESYLQSALKLCKEVAPRLNLSAVCQQFVACHFYNGVLELCLCCATKVDPNNAALHFYKNNEPVDDQEGNFAYIKRLDIYKEVTTMLDHLYNQSTFSSVTPTIPNKPGPPNYNSSQNVPMAKELLNEIIYEAVRSPCETLHASVYAWMIEKGLHGELVALAAPSLENYLVKVNAPELLWQYYERNKNHAAAAKILDALSTKPCAEVTLTQRVEFLARAVVCMRSDEAGYAPYLGVFLRELEDKVEVARIQKQILDTISNQQHRFDPMVVRDAKLRLNSTLLDITQLYEDYAEPLQLWECKLAIIHCSGHQDAMLIQGIWTNIIDNELLQMREEGSATLPEDKMAILTSKIKMLGLEYPGTPHCFPTDFLIKQLELRACKLGASNNHIITCFLQLGVPMEDLLEYYDKMIGGNNRTWLSEGNEFHLIESTANLVNYFTNHSNITNNFVKRKIITKSQDVISKCLTTLFSKTNGGELITKLRAIQSVLNRL